MAFLTGEWQLQKVGHRGGAEGAPTLEVGPFFDKVPVIENTESRALVYIMIGFSGEISDYGKMRYSLQKKDWS